MTPHVESEFKPISPTYYYVALQYSVLYCVFAERTICIFVCV